jgi:carboxyl-terminal processing protease
MNLFRPLCLFIFSCISLGIYAQAPKNYNTEIALLNKSIRLNHFSPRAIDDDYAGLVFSNFLNQLDPEKLYFSSVELQMLSETKGTIDDEVNGKAGKFLSIATEIYKKCLIRAENSIQQISLNAFEFNTKEILKIDTAWLLNEEAIKSRWRQQLKLDALRKLIEMKVRYENVPYQEFITKHEPEVRQRIKQTNLRQINKILNHPDGYERYVATAYLKAITSSFDPHSLYLPPVEMENFKAAISTSGYHFGFNIGEDEHGAVVITDLMPGGPAWKSGEVHKGDIIKLIQWQGKDAIDVNETSIEKISQILAHENHSELTIVLSDVAGQQKVIKLKKEKIETEENIVKSFILKGSKNIGFIILPGFYTDWGETDGANCANDVAKEIIKLKKENIDGLIVDLRFNGGGSLMEAVNMAGIFIDAGPVGLIRSKGGETLSVKDLNRGTIYDGPLIILVNGMSASASEFFAAAMQDYNRAIIVGDRTFGKATAQNPLPLDPNAKFKSKFGFVNITMHKIYRITGKTAQCNGVTPDIELHDAISRLKFREENYPLALPPDTVQKKVYYKPLPLLPLRELKIKSDIRTENNSQFKVLDQYSRSIEALQNNKLKTISLNWIDYKNLTEKQSNNIKHLVDELEKHTSSFMVRSHQFDTQHMGIDEHVMNLNNTWIKNLKKDILLEEAFNILCDYIVLSPSK